MSETSPSLSFTSLEVPAHVEGGANYLDYWKRHAEADPAMEGARELGRITMDGAHFVRDPDGRSPLAIIENWDAALGTFNHMRHGQGDLLRGAALLLDVNHEAGSGHLPAVRVSDPKDVAEAFLDVADRVGDMSDQQPSRALHLGGQLVHKAALIEKDAKRKGELLHVAATMYGRNYHADTPWTLQKVNDGQHLADINFHRLSQRIRSAVAAKQGVGKLQRQAAGMLHNQVNDLLRFRDMCGEAEDIRDFSGPAFELLTTIAVRHMIYLSDGIKADHSQIRTAFDSEDKAMHPYGTPVKRSFDLVHTRMTPRGEVVNSRLWQLKTGEARTGKYHPAIDVIAVRNVGFGHMLTIARNMQGAYKSGRLQSPIPQLPLVSEVVRPFMLPRPKAA